MKNLKIKKVLILGSGGLKIGQAGEFDYSGSQAIKSLKEEGIETILINPNIATVQTNKDLADKVYFLPIEKYFVEQVIKKEKPDGILLSFGGQTALNVGLELDGKVKVLGTPTKSIKITEDRDLFIKALKGIDVKVAKSQAVTNIDQGKKAGQKIGYPLMIRSAYALGGLGSGVVRNEKELIKKLKESLAKSPQILVEEYLEGWKEIEYEVVRDKYNNCVTVCNMENLDPMGIHTGESIVVAPSQTLNNHEYHYLRQIGIKVIQHLGIIGECNIQYAFKNGDYRVIEVNARLSRSSALASKATGYPLAFIAAKLALGYGLTEIKNSVTGTTCACFEPALDYLALKIPKWDLKKFKNVENRISSEMKSVGEVMALGRSFEEVLQKALRMVNIADLKVDNYLEEIKYPTDKRILALFKAFNKNHSVKEIARISKIDPWFLSRIENIADFTKKIKRQKINRENLLEAKKLGFSDRQIGDLKNKSEIEIRSLRKKYDVIPVIKQIDTLAGEFPAKTNYLYMTYHGDENDLKKDKNSLMVLGSGPYHIGSSVEFDWSCVQAVKTSSKLGYQTIMINCNPETVSTDYDECDRLYFEELTLERVLDIYEYEDPRGVIVSMGGQIPNNLAMDLDKNKVKILGTSPKNIDNAENRHKFSALLDEIGLDQPEWKELTNLEEAKKFANRVGYPVLIRPSYVLSGAAMNVAFDKINLEDYLAKAAEISSKYPVVISKFIKEAREIEIDGVAQNGKLIIYAISEHIEKAGIHSGDAHVVLPPQKTYLETVRRAKKRTKAVLKKLNITGPFNIQFLAKENKIQIIELNLRVSRSFPFVSKVTKYNFAEIATKAILNKNVRADYKTLDLDYVAVKSPQFSYTRLKGADPILYVEMGSTGEVAAFGEGYQEAFLKSILGTGFKLPEKNILLSIGKHDNKIDLLPFIKRLEENNYKILATEHTADFLSENNVLNTKLYKIQSKKDPNVKDYLENKKIDLIINIPTKYNRQEISDGYLIRRMATDFDISLINNLQIAKIFINSLINLRLKDLKIKSWDKY
ncbi:MAG: carbamoyl-phosphate synthase (glutamine-hydrolyzing) large subunit [Patescibacteria group bacterium]